MAATAGVTLIVAAACWNAANVNGVFTNEISVRRFVDVPQYAASALPRRAIFLTRVYSGSIRYYAGRPTIRWDLLPEHALDDVIAALEAHGFEPYIVIEARQEYDEFMRRFSGNSAGRLDWPPIAEYRGVELVRIYDARQRRGPAHSVHIIGVSPRQVPRTNG
jgi:hypothetical protein